MNSLRTASHMTERVVRTEASHACRPLQAGWILTLLTVLVSFITLGLSILHPGKGMIRDGNLVLLPPEFAAVYLPAIFLLSVTAICRGAVAQGLLLLLGSPLLVY